MNNSHLIQASCFFICLYIFTGDLLARQGVKHSVDTIKIGLLIPDKNSKSALNGAELAVRKANSAGGFNGIPFKVIVQSMEGPWGTGSKQAVNLIFDEKVCAIMGSHDSRNAHLVEQVTTKARIVFLSAWASDPTLSQAFIPWYFSCVPNDLRQADDFIKEIYTKRKIVRIAIIADTCFDSTKTLDNIVKRIKGSSHPEPLRITYNSDPENISDFINKTGCEGLILIGKAESFIRLLKFMQQQKKVYPVFGTLSLLSEDYVSSDELKYLENVNIIYAIQNHSTGSLSFNEEYKHQFGVYPGLIASFSFDGMTAIIKAILNGGTDRSEIQKSLAGIQFEGATGTVKFDEKGNRTGTSVTGKLKQSEYRNK